MLKFELIDRYIYAVTERLPEDLRDDVARELRTNIEDMLPENPEEKDVRSVLEKLGNPIKLSNEYRPEKKYLIGPDLYDSYIFVLKLVIGIAVIVFVSLSLLGAVSNQTDKINIIDYSAALFGDILAAAFQGAIQAFLWVTVVFERTGIDKGGKYPLTTNYFHMEKRYINFYSLLHYNVCN